MQSQEGRAVPKLGGLSPGPPSLFPLPSKGAVIHAPPLSSGSPEGDRRDGTATGPACLGLWLFPWAASCSPPAGAAAPRSGPFSPGSLGLSLLPPAPPLAGGGAVRPATRAAAGLSLGGGAVRWGPAGCRVECCAVPTGGELQQPAGRRLGALDGAVCAVVLGDPGPPAAHVPLGLRPLPGRPQGRLGEVRGPHGQRRGFGRG